MDVKYKNPDLPVAERVEDLIAVFGSFDENIKIIVKGNLAAKLEKEFDKYVSTSSFVSIRTCSDTPFSFSIN